MKPGLIHCIAGTILISVLGCAGNDSDFFDGRPSGLSQLHNSVISKPHDGLLELLQIPRRYPGATDPNISDWQQSIIAWWNHPSNQTIIKAHIGKLDPADVVALKLWLGKNRMGMSMENAKILDEILVLLSPTTP